MMASYNKLFITLLVLVELSVVSVSAGKCTSQVTNRKVVQHCPDPECQPREELMLKLHNLTVGTKANEVSTKDFGQVCINGSAKIPMNYFKETDTLDLRASIMLDWMGLRFPFPCGIIHSELTKRFLPEETTGSEQESKSEESGTEKKDEKKDETKDEKKSEEKKHGWIKDVLDRFDYNQCTMSDICGLFTPGNELRTLLDGLMGDSVKNNPELKVFDKFPKDAKNACSTDFLGAQLRKLTGCFPLGGEHALDFSAYKDMAMGADKIDLEMTLELLKRDEEDNEEHVLCLFMPLHVKFED